MERKDYRLASRKYVLIGATVFIVLCYIIRLFSIQILSDDYKKNADSNALMERTIYPSRGNIYDRNGKLLVYNQPIYDILMVMNEVPKYLDTLDLCRSLGITPEYYVKRLKEMKNRALNPGYSRYTEQVFMSQLSSEEYSAFKEKMFRFPGFSARRRSTRQYTYPSAALLLGDIGEVSKKEMERDDYYSRGDYIGKQGVENYYEKALRGIKGMQILLRDAHGRIQGHYLNGAEDVAPVPGKNITLGIDIELQRLGERLMQNKIGSIVAIEPESGEILCMVSAPTFNPTLLSGRRRGEHHIRLSKEKTKPLLNRAIMGAYPPGSTFKTSQALTFLQEGIITPETSFPCSGGFHYGRLKVGCHAHPAPLPLIPAVATSCNGYFCWGLFRMLSSTKKYLSVQRAMNTWRDYMTSMGFGYPLGVDLPHEKRGMIPNAQYYDKIYRGSWNGLTVISIAIGQGEVALTPLQIANLGATIANRGTYIIPHVIKSIEEDTIESRFLTLKHTAVEQKNYEFVIQGMRSAVLNGTCRAANLTDIEVCGKTGTAQNRGKDHSAFMGFAPMNQPRIAIMVYVENGGFGATYGVPIGALMMEQYLKGKLSPENEIKAEEIQNRIIDYGSEER